MTVVRAWQDVESVPDVGYRVVHCLEMDLARNLGDQNIDIRYVPFAAQEPTRLMAETAQWWAQFGAQAPATRSVLVIRQGDGPSHFASRYPGFTIPSYRDATLISADAVEVEVITRAVRDGYLLIQDKRPVLNTESNTPLEHSLIRAVVDRMWQESRLLYLPAGKTDFRTSKPAPPSIDLVGHLNTHVGYLSQEARERGTLAAFNAGFFISPEEEFDDPYTFALSPVGLIIADGRVISAPLFDRSALLFTRRIYPRGEDDAVYSLGGIRAVIRRVSLKHYGVKLPGDVVVRGEMFAASRVPLSFDGFAGESFVAALNPPTPSPDSAAFYNRLSGLVHSEITSLYTPRAQDRLELVISGTRICAIKEGGETFIPRNGFVVSLPQGRMADRIATAVLQREQDLVEQGLDVGDDAIQPICGVQVGLRLISDGVPMDLGKHTEEYRRRDVLRGEEGIPPVHLPPQHMFYTHRARIGFGIRPDNRCFVVMIEGREPRTFFPEYESSGGSAADLIKRLLDLGCRDAVTLDEGGSAQVSFNGRRMVRVADRNDVPLTPIERAIPGAWMVFER